MVSSFEDYLNMLESVLTSLAIAAAFIWFCWQAAIKPRIEFDVTCEFFHLDREKVLAQVCFIFRNTGFVQHKIYRLGLSIRCSGQTTPKAKINGAPDFDRSLIDIASLIAERHEYFFVRPGVRQIIRYSYILDNPARLVSVRGTFFYGRNHGLPHWCQRVFLITPVKINSNEVEMPPNVEAGALENPALP